MAENMTQGGVQLVTPIAPQIVYLDFDGELTRYNGELLTIDHVEVEHSLLTKERIENILYLLNEKYASQNVKFVTELPASGEYSTIYIGKTSAFDAYGTFAGLAETIDHNNANKSDNAFVNLDSSATDLEVVNTIAHETDHLLGTLDHGGEGMNAYAYSSTYHVSSGNIVSWTYLTHGDSMYISNQGIAISTTVVSSGFLQVESGGTAIETVVCSSGSMYVKNGGTANYATVSSGGLLYIFNGGSAANVNWTPCAGSVYVEDGGYVTYAKTYSGVYFGHFYELISSAQVMSSINVSAGDMYIFSGGKAYNTTVKNGGTVYISSGGSANNIKVYSGGDVQINGVANDITISGAYYASSNYYYNPHGIVVVSSGGLANYTTIDCGSMCINSGGTANVITVGFRAGLYVDGLTEIVTVASAGTMHVSDNGVVNHIVINSGGSVHVSSGGTATNVSWTPCEGYISFDPCAYVTFTSAYSGVYLGSYNKLVSSAQTMYLKTVSNGDMYVMADGAASQVEIAYSGSVYVHSGGLVYSTVISSGGKLIVSNGGKVDSATVNSYGEMSIFYGGSVDSLTVKSGGTVHVSSGGTATNVIWTPCEGYVYVKDDAVVTFASSYSGVYYRRSGEGVSSAQDVDGQYVYDMYIFESGIANSTYISSGHMFISSGGSANSTSNYCGSIYVCNGGVANNTEVSGYGYYNDSGYIFIEEDGVANFTIIGSCGVMRISSGGTANYTTLDNYFSGSIFIEDGGVANSICVNEGYLYISSGGTANNVLVNYSGIVHISSGGTASIEYNPWQGNQVFSSAGAVVEYLERDAGVYYGNSAGLISKADTMQDLFVSRYCSAIIFNGGTANSTTVDYGGSMFIKEGGVANSTLLNGSMLIFSGGIANSTTVGYWGGMYISNGGVANSTTVNSNGSISIFSGGIANSITVNSYGSMYIEEGGVANSVLVNGYLVISSGGTAGIEYNPWQGTISASDGAVVNYLERTAKVYYGSSAVGVLSKCDTLDDVVISSGISMIIFDGGEANNITVDSGGTMSISSGGTATNTTLYGGYSYYSDLAGYIFVENGGVANSTTINSYGSMVISSGGVANSTTVNSYGSMYISSGGTANSTTVNSYGSMYISSGGVANNTTLSGGTYYYQSAVMHISSGGVANSTTVNSYGSMYIEEGGVANSVLVNGYLVISSGGTAGIEYNPWQGTISASDGAVVNYLERTAKVYYGGSAVGVLSKCDTLDDVVIGSGIAMFIFNGGEANNITVDSGGTMSISSGGTATNTTLYGGYSYYSDLAGYIFVENGGVANSTTISSYGSMIISSGGTANNTEVSGYGYYYNSGVIVVQYGGVANSTIVGSRGVMCVSSGGTANSAMIESYGSIYIEEGGVANSVLVKGSLTVCSGGTARIEYNPWQGTISVSDGAVVEYLERTAKVYYGGSAVGILSKCDTLDDVVISSGIAMFIFNGGEANNITVDSGGTMSISSGGTATNTTLYGGYSYYSDLAGYIFVENGGVANSTTINSHGSMFISSGGTANSTTVSSNGVMDIDAGGIANYVLVFGGSMYISSGGTASIAYNPWQGRIYSASGAVVEYLERDDNIYYGNSYDGLISKGDTMQDFCVTYGNSALIYSDGVINSVTNSGCMYIFDGGIASNIANNRGSIYIHGGGVINRVELNGSSYRSSYYSATLNISSGGTANSVTVNSRGVIYVAGVANNTTVSNNYGSMYIEEGGVANNTVVSNGKVYISAGGVHKGSLQIEYGNVSAYSGAIIDFTVAGRSVEDGYLINDLLRIKGAPTYTITVSADQKFGTYKLAQSVSSAICSSSIKIGDETSSYGSITANGDIFHYNGVDYLLKLEDRNLYLSIGDFIPPGTPVVSADITTATNQNVTVTAVFSDDSVIREYSFDNITWVTYTTGVVMTSNGTVYFRAKDNAGNESVITEYQVTNIDQNAPDGPVVTADITTPTNKDVTITAEFSTDSVIREYSFDNITWNTYTDGIVMTDNGTVYFRSIDSLGNVSTETQYTVDYIDKIAPEAPTVELQSITEDCQDVALTVTFAEEDITKQYSLDQINWQEYTEDFVPAENTAYYFRAVDAVGNVGNMASIAIADYRVKTFSGGVLAQYGSRLDSVTMTKDAVNAMYVSSGGLAYGTQVNKNTELYVLSGGSALQTYVMKSATLNVGSDAVFSGIIVSSGGKIEIASGCVVNDLTFMRYASTDRDVVLHSSGGPNKDEEVRGDKITPVTNATVNRFTLESRCLAEASDALLYNVTLRTAAQLKCLTGEKEEGKMILSGAVVHSDAQLIMEKFTVASDVIVSKAATLKIQNGGRAINTVIDRDGKLEMIGLVQHTVLNGGSMYVGDTAYHDYDGTGGMPTSNVYEEDIHAEDTVLNSSWLHVYSGGTATSNMVNSNSWLHVYYGGTATSNTVNSSGYITVHGSGTLDTVEVHSGGYLRLNAGSVLKGDIFAGGKVTVSSAGTSATEDVVRAYGANIYFMVNERTTSDEAIITDLGMIMGAAFYITVAHNQTSGMYKLATGASDFTGSISIGTNGSNYGSLTVNGASISYNGVTCSLVKENDQLMLSISGSYSVNVSGDKNGVLFYDLSLGSHVVTYSQNNFANGLSVNVDGNAVDTYGMAAGTYQWQVDDIKGNDIISDNIAEPQKFVSDADGNLDLFFAEADGTWIKGYAAEHHGILYGWDGTGERVSLKGKNQLCGIFAGSSDANILVMTDDTNGDALFVDDIYTALPGTITEQQARIAQIDEIRAGAGNDIVDMTSQMFAYTGDAIKIYGGLGDDVIWANNGKNTLFGDAGNDRIVGGGNNDVIIGGSGDDSMHGGGGNDIFTFGENWGKDMIEQLSGGNVTLWFENGSVSNWNASTMTYTDGANSVKISGITADQVTLKFGDVDTAVAGAFLDAASEKIFEDKNKGMIA